MFLLVTGALVFSSAAFKPAVAAEKVYELHAASVVAETPNDRHAIKFRAMMKEVEERTNGKVKIIFHPGGELGGEREYIEMLQTGDLAFCSIATSVLSGFTRSLMFYDFPMLFKDQDQLFEFTKSDLGKSKLAKLEEIDIVGLAANPAGSRNVLTVAGKPVNKLADMKGLKIRVMETPIHIEGMKLLGAQPIPMPYNECYQSMQTGVIDGMENELSTYLAMRFYEVAPNFAQIGWLQLIHVTLASKQIMDELPAEYQQIIREAAVNASIYATERGMKYDTTDGVETAKKAGANLIELDNAEFRAQLTPLIEKNKDMIGQDVLDWIKANE